MGCFVQPAQSKAIPEPNENREAGTVAHMATALVLAVWPSHKRCDGPSAEFREPVLCSYSLLCNQGTPVRAPPATGHDHTLCSTGAPLLPHTHARAHTHAHTHTHTHTHAGARTPHAAPYTLGQLQRAAAAMDAEVMYHGPARSYSGFNTTFKSPCWINANAEFVWVCVLCLCHIW